MQLRTVARFILREIGDLARAANGRDSGSAVRNLL
jgi:hypothetical protein